MPSVASRAISSSVLPSQRIRRSPQGAFSLRDALPISAATRLSPRSFASARPSPKSRAAPAGAARLFGDGLALAKERGDKRVAAEIGRASRREKAPCGERRILCEGRTLEEIAREATEGMHQYHAVDADD